MSGAPAKPIIIPPEFRPFIVTDDFDRYGLEVGQPTEMPHYLQIELTDLCNLKCAGCVRAEHDSVGAVLDLDSFVSILDQLPRLEHVSFVGAGEALMVRDFAGYVRACTDRGVFSSTNTNGLLIRRRLQAALEAGLGLLAVSVDGADDNILGPMRSGLRASQLSAGLHAAALLVDGTDTRLSAAVTLSSMNLASFGDIVDYVADHGIKELTVESLHHWGDDKRLNKQSLFAQDPASVVQRLEDGLGRAIARGIKVTIFDYSRLASSGANDAVCPWPWDASFITKDGDVTPCCVNMEAAAHNLLGNAVETPIQDIWTAQRYQDFRESFVGGPTWSSCDGCVYRMEFGRVG